MRWEYGIRPSNKGKCRSRNCYHAHLEGKNDGAGQYQATILASFNIILMIGKESTDGRGHAYFEQTNVPGDLEGECPEPELTLPLVVKCQRKAQSCVGNIDNHLSIAREHPGCKSLGSYRHAILDLSIELFRLFMIPTE